MSKHKYADILIAIANGEQIQRTDTGCEWYNIGNREVLASIALGMYDQFRVKSKTININGFEVSAPMKVVLTEEMDYFIASPTHDCLYEEYKWFDDNIDNKFLERGLLHLTAEAAIIHSEALLSFTKGK